MRGKSGPNPTREEHKKGPHPRCKDRISLFFFILSSPRLAHSIRFVRRQPFVGQVRGKLVSPVILWNSQQSLSEVAVRPANSLSVSEREAALSKRASRLGRPRMDHVPTAVITACASLLRHLAGWLDAVAARRRVPSVDPEQPTTCFHASCPQEAVYFGRCTQHAPTPGVHYCTQCWRVIKAHPAGEPCPGGQFSQAAPKKAATPSRDADRL